MVPKQVDFFFLSSPGEVGQAGHSRIFEKKTKNMGQRDSEELPRGTRSGQRIKELQKLVNQTLKVARQSETLRPGWALPRDPPAGPVH